MYAAAWPPHLVATAFVITHGSVSVALVVKNIKFFIRAPAFHPILGGHIAGIKVNTVVEAVLQNEEKRHSRGTIEEKGMVKNIVAYADDINR